MKYIKYIFVVILSFTFFNLNVLAEESKFEPRISISYEDNYINVILGYEGEIANNLQQKIAYQEDKMKLVGINNLEDFAFNRKKESKSGKWTIIDLNMVSSEYADNSNYIILTFSKDNFKKGDLFLYNYEINSHVDKFSHHHSGYLVSFKKRGKEINHTIKLITSKTKRTYLFDSLKPYLYTILIVAFLAFVFVMLKPSKYVKEDKKEKLNDRIKNSNNVIVGKKITKEVKKEDDDFTIISDEEIESLDNESLTRMNSLFDEEEK